MAKFIGSPQSRQYAKQRVKAKKHRKKKSNFMSEPEPTVTMMCGCEVDINGKIVKYCDIHEIKEN